MTGRSPSSSVASGALWSTVVIGPSREVAAAVGPRARGAGRWVEAAVAPRRRERLAVPGRPPRRGQRHRPAGRRHAVDGAVGRDLPAGGERRGHDVGVVGGGRRVGTGARGGDGLDVAAVGGADATFGGAGHLVGGWGPAVVGGDVVGPG